MGKYSSDSDSSSYKGRSKRKNRSSSSSSGSVKHSSYRSKHSSSTSRRDRYSKKSSRYKNRRSRSKSNHRSRSYSRENSRRRSRSYDRYSSKSKSYRSKTSSRRSSSSSNSSKSPIQLPTTAKPAKANEALREKLLKSIQAADSADKLLKQQGALPKNYKSRNDLAALVPSKPSIEVLNDIENESFQQRAFVSVKNIEIPEIKLENNEDVAIVKSVLPSSVFDDQEAKLQRWVKKLFQIRQRALKGDGVE